MARLAFDKLTNAATSSWLDLAELDLQPYPRSEGERVADIVRAAFNDADGMVLACPTYNWGPAASLTNFLHYVLDPDHGRRSRPFAILASAGSHRSHLALEGIGRSMLHEIHGIQIGPPIIGTAADVDRDSGHVGDPLAARIEAAMAALVRHAIAGQMAELSQVS